LLPRTIFMETPTAGGVTHEMMSGGRGYFQVLLARRNVDETVGELRLRGVPSAELQLPPLLVCRIRDSRFASFLGAISGVGVEPVVFTHPDLVVLLRDGPKFHLTPVQIDVGPVDDSVTEEIHGFLDEHQVEPLLEFLSKIGLLLRAVEFYDIQHRSLFVYGSGLVYADGDPVTDSEWNQTLSGIVIHIARP